MDRYTTGYAELTEELYGVEGKISLNPLSMPGHFLRDQNQILMDEKDKQILRDMTPWLEYYLFVNPVREEIHRNSDAITNFESRIR